MYNYTYNLFNMSSAGYVVPYGIDYIVVFLGIIAFCQIFFVLVELRNYIVMERK